MTKKKDEVVEEIKIEGVNEIPENEEVIEEVEIETPNDEVSEELVQAIVEEAKEYTGDLRGFKTYEEMINYPNTPEFKKLDIGCQNEYTNWLKNIL